MTCTFPGRSPPKPNPDMSPKVELEVGVFQLRQHTSNAKFPGFPSSLSHATACLGRIRVSHGFCHRSMAKPIYHGKTHDIWVLPCNGFSHSSMAKPMDIMKRNIHGFCHGPLLHGFCPLNQRWRKFFCCQLYLFWQLYLVERLLLFFQFFSLKWILHVIFESLKIDLMLLAFLIPKCVSSDSLDKS